MRQGQCGAQCHATLMARVYCVGCLSTVVSRCTEHARNTQTEPLIDEIHEIDRIRYLNT